MKILLLTTRFPPYKGGVETVVENLASILAKNHDIKVFASLELDALVKEYSRGSEGKLAKLKYGFKVIDKDKQFTQYPVYRFWIQFPRSLLGVLSFPYRLFSSTYELIRHTKEFNPDVINYHFPDDSSLYMWILMKFVKIPLVLNIHGHDLHNFSNKFPYSFFINGLVSKASTIVVNSEYMKDGFTAKFDRYSDKVRIIPNGIDTSYFYSIEPRPYFPDKYAFYIGRVVHKKGVDIMLRAYAKADIDSLPLLIEGKGEELSGAKELVKNLGISDRVVFTDGKLSEDEKNAYMKAAEFGIIPSRIEPFGIVALEMMACGLPIVSSKTGGLASIMRNNRNCLFFENENIDDLAEKIKMIYEDRELKEKMREKNLKDSLKFDNKAVSEQYVAAYQEVL